MDYKEIERKQRACYLAVCQQQWEIPIFWMPVHQECEQSDKIHVGNSQHDIEIKVRHRGLWESQEMRQSIKEDQHFFWNKEKYASYDEKDYRQR